MKKGFTLVELLVVVVVIAILASVVFRLGGVGSNSAARNRTVSRLQCLENCISGYFAAYGSYPPVALQGRSRNIFYKVNGSGIQQVEDDPNTSLDLSSPAAIEKSWRQVDAACRAQPVAVRYPFKKGLHSYVKKLSDTLVERGKKNMVFDALDNPDQLSNKKESGEWTETQLFQFGLLSYLLPRYLVMMGYGIESGGGSDQAAAANLYDGFDQWGDNNSMPCQFEDGLQFVSWSAVNAVLGKADEKWKIAALPSQAVTARWLPNLEGILTCAIPIGNLYGVAVSDGTRIDLDNPPSEDEIYSSGDSQSGENGAKSQPYILDRITCLDGWGRDFYYYSPPPYQGYRLWSAGANGKTFPPWIPDEQIKKMSNENVIRNWLSDDIVHMSN